MRQAKLQTGNSWRTSLVRNVLFLMIFISTGAGYHSESKAKEYKHVCKRACQRVSCMWFFFSKLEALRYFCISAVPCNLWIALPEVTPTRCQLNDIINFHSQLSLHDFGYVLCNIFNTHMNSFLLTFADCYYIVSIQNVRYANKSVLQRTVMHRLASCNAVLFLVQSAV